MSAITKVLEEAIQEVRNLPEPDQESIGRQLLSHVERLRRLRVEIDNGLHSLNTGGGSELDIEEFIQEKNAGDGRGYTTGRLVGRLSCRPG